MVEEGTNSEQVMDTPGLLPRSDQERNEMEKLTLASMVTHAIGHGGRS